MKTASPIARLAAIAASIVVTFSLVTTIATMARPPAESPLLAQAGTAVVR